MTDSYTAWDGNRYVWPPPDGWYESSDGRWWPDGHGPGPVPPPIEPAPVVAPVPPPESASRRTFLLLGGLLAGVIVLGLGFFALSRGDDANTASPTSVPDATTEPPTSSLEATTEPPTSSLEATTEPPTTEPSTTEPAVVEAGGPGTRQSPYGTDEIVTIFYDDLETDQEKTWSVEIIAPVADMTEAVMAENQFNEPPAEGDVFAGASIRVVYESGPESANTFELTFKSIGTANRAYTTFENTCGVVPSEFDAFAELGPGDVVEGTVCWAIPEGELASLVLLIEAFLVDGEVYMELSPS